VYFSRWRLPLHANVQCIQYVEVRPCSGRYSFVMVMYDGPTAANFRRQPKMVHTSAAEKCVGRRRKSAALLKSTAAADAAAVFFVACWFFQPTSERDIVSSIRSLRIHHKLAGLTQQSTV